MATRRVLLPALVCVLVLPLVALIIHPGLELGLNDDWSYIRSAQVLADTGHFVYNGWSTASLGWQLYLGALFIKLFGFSFTIVRSTTLLVAALTALTFYFILIRCGVDEWLSALGTLTLVLSPLFLPLTFSYMTDVGGLLIILLCLYACLRALTAPAAKACFAWLCVAALSNAVGGTVRQIAWLGVLVMVPSTLWLVRRRWPRLLLPAVAVILVADLGSFLAYRWFTHQPLFISEPLIPASVTSHAGLVISKSFLRAALEFPFFLLPALVMFVAALPRVRRVLLLLSLGLVAVLMFAVWHSHRHNLAVCLFPYMGNYVANTGIMTGTPLQGFRPTVLGFHSRLLLTAFYGFSAVAAALFLLTPASADSPLAAASPAFQLPGRPTILTRELAWIVGPFTLAYLLFLVPRAASGGIFDRYMLPLIAIGLLVLLHGVQQKLWPLVSLRPFAFAAGLLTLAAFAAFSIAGTHDMFSLFRAQSLAAAEIQQAGVDPRSIDGGFEFNAWTQLQQAGFVTDPRLAAAPGQALVPPPWKPCEPMNSFLLPSLRPRYGLSFQPGLCGGATDFPAVAYSTWLAPHHGAVYVIQEHPSSVP